MPKNYIKFSKFEPPSGTTHFRIQESLFLKKILVTEYILRFLNFLGSKMYNHATSWSCDHFRKLQLI